MSKKAITLILTLLLAAVTAVICTIQYKQYMTGFQKVTIHEHTYQLSMPDHAVIYDINEIGISDLSAIPGVSKAHAAAILQRREELGGFTDISQLAEIEALPPSLLDTLESFLYIAPTEPTGTTNPPIAFPIDLNTADKAALIQIPGIGEKTADAILSYREHIGSFTSLRQLLDIPGIGDKTLAQLTEYLYIPEEILQTETSEPNTEPMESATQPTELPVSSETLPPVPPIINLNTTTKEELMLLPGCTEAIAEEILQLRDNIHVFSNILEIMYIESITVDMYKQWKHYLTVGEETTTETIGPASE